MKGLWPRERKTEISDTPSKISCNSSCIEITAQEPRNIRTSNQKSGCTTGNDHPKAILRGMAIDICVKLGRRIRLLREKRGLDAATACRYDGNRRGSRL